MGALERHETSDAAFGGDGYDWIEQWAPSGWRAVPSWGRDGWDLGDWPLVVVMHRDRPDVGRWDVAIRVEGDITVESYASPEERDAATDETAMFFWRLRCEPWVAGIAESDPVPDCLRGPFSWARLNVETGEQAGTEAA